MIAKNLNKSKKKPKRVIILGGNSFIGTYLKIKLKQQNVKYLSITRNNIDLTSFNKTQKLKKIVKPQDTIILIAAKAPVKNFGMFEYNLKIIKNFCEIMKNEKFKHFIYLSSDAVYSDTKKKITENSATAPDNYHGLMHFSREQILKIFFKKKMCVIRPTLVFGASDPHNGYGPNKFWRYLKIDKNIKLFGKGEERRDHIWVNDVAEIMYNCIVYNTIGTINAVSGKITSFFELAKKLKFTLNSKSKIIFTKRKGKMPHGGYRAFDNNLIKKLFPKFKINKLEIIFQQYKNYEKY